MVIRLIILLGLFPFYLLAQDAAGILPEMPKLKDTTKQRDLIDIAKSWLHIKSKIILEEREKMVYFTFLPLTSSVPGGDGRVLITSTTLGTYFGPRKTTNISSATFAPYWNFSGRFGLPFANQCMVTRK